jgi:MFS family permease
MFGRSLDDSFAPEIKRNVSAVVIARLVANACYRFAPPFLAIIAKSFDVSLSQIGVAIFVSELTGFASPFLGRVVDRLSHRNAMVLGLLGTGIGCTIAAAAPNVVVFAIGVTFLGLTKQCFDLGLGAWIADFVPYNQRGKVVGITEMGWALGLLVGVSLMGIVTSLTNWRIGYAFGVSAVIACVVVLISRINNEPRKICLSLLVLGSKTTLASVPRALRLLVFHLALSNLLHQRQVRNTPTNLVRNEAFLAEHCLPCLPVSQWQSDPPTLW